MPCAFQSTDPLGPAGCQFNVAQDDLVVVEHPAGPQDWCQFHLPLATESGDPLKLGWDPARIEEFNEAIFAHIKRAGPIVDLSGVVFPGTISFSRYRREHSGLPGLFLLRATFAGDAAFRRVAFSGEADFTGVTFLGQTDFSGASFKKNVFFESGIFGGTTYFRNAAFSGVARFKKASFDRVTTFEGATFHSLADFEATRVRQGVIFDEAIFGGEANFEKAKFEGDAMFFGDPTAEGPAGRRDLFRRSANFKGTQFEKRAIFTNRRFLDTTDFNNAAFAVAPKFHNCILHQDTSFSGAKFFDRSGDGAMAYRTLKLAMASVRATNEEVRFYGLEQRSLRANPNTALSVRLASWLYEKSADYGQSFLRPLMWLVGTFVLFSFVYLGYFALFLGPVATWADSQGVFRFALQQVFQPFFTFRAGAVVPGAGQTVPLWLAFLAAVHSLFTLGFLTLFLLALRRRFRLH